MNDNALRHINELINKKKIKEAQVEISKLGSGYYKNSEYLYLRGKIFYSNKLYYLAIDTLLTALEFEKKDKIYILIGKIYIDIGNKELSNKISDLSSRELTVKSLKDELSGIFQKNN